MSKSFPDIQKNIDVITAFGNIVPSTIALLKQMDQKISDQENQIAKYEEQKQKVTDAVNKQQQRLTDTTAQLDDHKKKLGDLTVAHAALQQRFNDLEGNPDVIAAKKQAKLDRIAKLKADLDKEMNS